MTKHGRGGGAPGKGEADGKRGGNRGGSHDEARRRGPGNDQQAKGKDPHRGEPGDRPAAG